MTGAKVIVVEDDVETTLSYADITVCGRTVALFAADAEKGKMVYVDTLRNATARLGRGCMEYEGESDLYRQQDLVGSAATKVWKVYPDKGKVEQVAVL